jgi:hypothetical protein
VSLVWNEERSGRMTKRGLGYKPDPEGYVRAAYDPAGVVIPANVMWLHMTPAVMDQDGTGSCTGHAVAAGIYAAYGAASVMGLSTPLPWVPSPDSIYRNGRCIDRRKGPDGKFPPLVDDGARPNEVFRGVREFGIQSMGEPIGGRYSDVSADTVNAEPTLTDLQKSMAKLVVGDHKVAPSASSVAAALANGHPVCAAIAGGSDGFQNYNGGVMDALHAPLDHYVLIVGYDTVSLTGERIFYGQNSWGLRGATTATSRSTSRASLRCAI